MNGDLPRGADGLLPCDRCGEPITQPPTGRRRRYCSRNCRELAYRERKTRRLIAAAVEAAVEQLAPATARQPAVSNPQRQHRRER
jgi:predicted nucleic acid-binding Zn ribbon protein